MILSITFFRRLHVNDKREYDANSNRLLPNTMSFAGRFRRRLNSIVKNSVWNDENSSYFREAMIQAKFDIGSGMHPIVPVIVGDERKAGEVARRLFDLGVFVTSYAFPIVAHGSARIRA